MQPASPRYIALFDVEAVVGTYAPTFTMSAKEVVEMSMIRCSISDVGSGLTQLLVCHHAFHPSLF